MFDIVKYNLLTAKRLFQVTPHKRRGEEGFGLFCCIVVIQNMNLGLNYGIIEEMTTVLQLLPK